MNRSAFILLALLFSPVQGLHAASFDCQHAKTETEHLICGDGALSALDDQMAAAYTRLQRRAQNSVQIRRAQRAWLQGVRDRCMDRACLHSVYEKRIEELVQPTEGLYGINDDIHCVLEAETPNETRVLRFGIEGGKVTHFEWRAVWAPTQPDDLRPGFHYSSRLVLADVEQMVHADDIVLTVKAIRGLSPDQCRVLLSRKAWILHAYTQGCESRPPTSNFDYVFYQSGSMCEPEVR